MDDIVEKAKSNAISIALLVIYILVTSVFAEDEKGLNKSQYIEVAEVVDRMERRQILALGRIENSIQTLQAQMNTLSKDLTKLSAESRYKGGK